MRDELAGMLTVQGERIEALFRWLLDEGHMTPIAVIQLRAVLGEDMTDV